MMRRTAGGSTIALFTAIGVVALIVLVTLPGYRRPPIRLLAIPALLAFSLTPAVVPAAMRLAGQRHPAGPFVITVAVVVAIQLALTNVVIPLVQQETARRNPSRWMEPGSLPLSAHTAARLIGSVSRGVPGAWIARDELARRAALAAAPALLSIIGWQLGNLFGAAWLRVAAVWGVLGFFVTVTTPSPYRGAWWLASLWLTLLAIGLTAAARFVPPADRTS